MTERKIGVKLSFARTKYRYGFSRNEDLLGFFDDEGKFMTDEEVVDRLNELNIENVKLKEANKNLKKKIIELSHKLKNNRER